MICNATVGLFCTASSNLCELTNINICDYVNWAEITDETFLTIEIGETRSILIPDYLEIDTATKESYSN